MEPFRMDPEQRAKFNQVFGEDRMTFLCWQIFWYAEHPKAKCDVTFYRRQPLIDVTIEQKFSNELTGALLYGAGSGRLRRILNRVRFSDGPIVGAGEIWTLNYMPDDLDVTGVDVSVADKSIIGEGGENLRQMISETYHCKSRAEEDYFIARWIAS
jgi:hypothetical protein